MDIIKKCRKMMEQEIYNREEKGIVTDCFDKIINIMELNVDKYSNNPEFWNLFAFVYLLKKDTKKAIEIVEKGLKFNPNSKILLKDLIEYNFCEKNFSKTIVLGNEYLKSVGIHSQILDDLAYSYDRMGEPEKAIKTYKESIKKSLDFTQNIGYWVALSLKSKHFIPAIIMVKKYLLLHPDDLDYWYTLGNTYFKNNEYEEGIKILEYAQSKDKEKDLSGHLLGYAYFKAGKVEKGIALIKKSLEVDPNSRWALKHLAKAYLKLGKYDEVIEIVDKMIKTINDIDKVESISKKQLKEVKGELTEKALKLKEKAVQLKNQQ